MALLSSYAYQSKTYRKISSTYEHVVSTGEKTYLWYNRNKLLKTYSYATGGKNGYTPKAGKTLVTTAEKDGLRLTIVTLKDSDPFNHHQNLYQTYFDLYHAYKIVDQDTFSLSSPYLDGIAYIQESFTYPLKESEKKDVQVLAKIPNQKRNRAEEVGTIEVKLREKVLTNIPIYQKLEQKKKSFFERLKLFFTKT